MANSTEEVRTKESVLKSVLNNQKKVEKTIHEAQKLCASYKSNPGSWSSIQIKIVNELMQAVSEVQTLVAMLPEFSTNKDLQNIQAYLGDEFGLFSDITALTTMLSAGSAKSESDAVLDEISGVCDTILKRVKDIRNSAAKVSAAL
jgi:hypothetical protein